MDITGQPLEYVLQQLNALQCKYDITLTNPPRFTQTEGEACLYVIRQDVTPDGVYHLIAAAKMKK